jgi:hypothetical protein
MHLWIVAVVAAATLSVVACGASPAQEKPRGTDAQDKEKTTAIAGLSTDDPLLEDAKMYAEDRGIPLEEAVRRLHIQEGSAKDVADLERLLRKHEAETFAGLWLQHEPEYRYVVLFTRDGEETLRPYVEGGPLEDTVEARSGADATMAELHFAQREADRITRSLNIATASGINLQKNRAEVYVPDRAKLETALRKAGTRLPEHVAMVEESLPVPQ